MKKEYIKPQTLVMCVETMAPIAASVVTVPIVEDDGSDYNGAFYSPSKPNRLWTDDEE